MNLGDRRCAIPVSCVREVVRGRRTVGVPATRPPVRGLASVRGDIVTVVDLAVAAEMDVPAAAGPGEGWMVVLRDDSAPPPAPPSAAALASAAAAGRTAARARGRVALAVDGVEDIRSLGAPSRVALPGRTAIPGKAALRGPWSGVVRDGDVDVPVLDAARLHAALDRLVDTGLEEGEARG